MKVKFRVDSILYEDGTTRTFDRLGISTERRRLTQEGIDLAITGLGSSLLASQQVRGRRSQAICASTAPLSQGRRIIPRFP